MCRPTGRKRHPFYPLPLSQIPLNCHLDLCHVPGKAAAKTDYQLPNAPIRIASISYDEMRGLLTAVAALASLDRDNFSINKTILEARMCREKEMLVTLALLQHQMHNMVVMRKIKQVERIQYHIFLL